jgi:hypothetical protein
MTYELAKKLKDAGFKSQYFRTEDYYPDVNVPTLSELIEACGGNAKALIQQDSKTQWEYAVDGKGALGQTPEEAVANLWLELNKKILK